MIASAVQYAIDRRIKTRLHNVGCRLTIKAFWPLSLEDQGSKSLRSFDHICSYPACILFRLFVVSPFRCLHVTRDVHYVMTSLFTYCTCGTVAYLYPLCPDLSLCFFSVRRALFCVRDQSRLECIFFFVLWKQFSTIWPAKWQINWICL